MSIHLSTFPWQPELFELVVAKLKLDLELKIASCAALWMF